ncbi:MAG: hypothetical protein QX195_04775 [Methylococcaceae bacterium]
MKKTLFHNRITIGVIVFVAFIAFNNDAFALPISAFFKGLARGTKTVAKSAKDYAENLVVDKVQGIFSSNPANSNLENAPEYAKIAREHFYADKRCDVSTTIDFYANSVYYDDKQFDIQGIRKIKEDACSRFSSGVTTSIKDDYLAVNDFEDDSSIKLVIYDVDFEYYSQKKQRTVTGTTRIFLAISVDSQKIIAELHKLL